MRFIVIEILVLKKVLSLWVTLTANALVGEDVVSVKAYL